jgi:hypothetical protein
MLMLSQLLSYSIVAWAAFIVVAYCFARYLPRRAIPLGHLVNAVIITALDLYWIQTEIHREGWNGLPDQDFVFFMGVIIRIIMINTVLLPVTALGSWLRNRSLPTPPATGLEKTSQST